MNTSKHLPMNPYDADSGLTESADGEQLTKATLTLAYEQRTANLIALAGLPGTAQSVKMTATKDAMTRLGL